MELKVGLLFDLSVAPGDEDRSQDFLAAVLDRGQQGLTVCVNSDLTQQWLERGCLDRLQSLLRYGLVELTGTAAYHPILPLLHQVEARRQIVLNTLVNQRLLGERWQPAGLFPPELAYGHELVPLLPALGLRWCLSDDAAFGALHGWVPYETVVRVGELLVPLRSRHWSEVLAEPGDLPGAWVADRLLKACSEWFQRGYLILALPGHNLGQLHYRQFLWDFLAQLQSHAELVHLSHIVDSFPAQDLEVPPGSWKTSVEDFWAGDFFAPWNSPRHPQHQILWRLSELAWASLERLKNRLDRGMASANFEWVTRPNTPPPESLDCLLDVIAAGQPEQLEQARRWRELLD